MFETIILNSARACMNQSYLLKAYFLPKSDWPMFPKVGATGLAWRSAWKVAVTAPCKKRAENQKLTILNIKGTMS